MKVTIKNRFNYSVIFEHESKGNTIKKTLELAIKRGADLSGADLSGTDLSVANLSVADLRVANLSGADLRGTDLSGTDLSVANLSGADLRVANLSGANLSVANLSGADLRGTDLSGANLSVANLSGANLPVFCKWSHSIINGKIKIGCKENTIEGWESFFNSDATYETKRNTQDFKQIQAVFESYKAYLNFLHT